MNRSLARTRPTILALTVAIVAGCAHFTPEAAHENFKRDLRADIGQDIDHSTYTSLDPRLRLSEERLANGQIRYRYKSGIGNGQCTTIYDVDPLTRKIVAVNFEGSTRECSLPP
jgi:hypothetical protein